MKTVLKINTADGVQINPYMNRKLRLTPCISKPQVINHG